MVTLVDGLDTLVIMNEFEEFEKGMNLIKAKFTLDNDVTINVFECTIRELGGLLSIHLMASSNSHRLSKPYQGEFLEYAKELGDKLFQAFNTLTGIPYSRVFFTYSIEYIYIQIKTQKVNLKNGITKGESLENCVAGAGTLLLEFGTLSRLTGDLKYEVHFLELFFVLS